MKKALLCSLSVLMLLSISGTCAFAQKLEVHPYAGGMLLTDFSRSHFTREMDFVNPGMFGVKGSVALTDRIRLEGNVGHLNQFTFRENPLGHDIHGLLWEGGGSYDWFRGRF